MSDAPLPDLGVPEEFRRGMAFAIACADTEIARLREALEHVIAAFDTGDLGPTRMEALAFARAALGADPAS